MWNNVYELTKFKLPKAKILKGVVAAVSRCPNCTVQDYFELEQIGKTRRCKICGMLYMPEARTEAEDFSKWDGQCGPEVVHEYV